MARATPPIASAPATPLEPQVNMRKFDPSTGELIDDKRINGELAHRLDRQRGTWRAEMVTLPLVAPVRGVTNLVR